MAYEWCSVVCEHYDSLRDGKDLLFLSLELGFRHLPPEDRRIGARLTHKDHHQQMADIVFKDGSGETIADFLHAWASSSDFHQPHPSLNMCANDLIGLQNLHPFSQRLRQCIIHSIRLIGYQPFEQVGAGGFVGLLNGLDLCAKDIDVNVKVQWARLLLDTIQSPEGVQHLLHSYWELLVELSISVSQYLKEIDQSPDIMASPRDSQEWDKLECGIGLVWMIWTPEDGALGEEHLKDMTDLLFHEKPGAIEKLGQWMEQWSTELHCTIPRAFQQVTNKHVLK